VTTDLSHHQDGIHEISIKVENLIRDESVSACFIEHIQRLCKMVEDYGHGLQPYVKKLKNTRKRIEEKIMSLPPGTSINLYDECPHPKGWVEMGYLDNFFIKDSGDTMYRPTEPANPLLWFGFFGNPYKQRNPTENERLMCKYVLLAIIHDMELREPIYKPIFPDKYYGKYFALKEFRLNLWEYYYYPNREHTYRCLTATAQEKLSTLNFALEDVKTDCAKKEPTEVSGRQPEHKAKSIIVPIIISLIVVFLFQLFVYIVPVTWVINHPNSYGIQGSIICLIPCLIVGFFKPTWRKWFWAGAVLAFLAVLLSLIGGPR
jgi:hypothetical protein